MSKEEELEAIKRLKHLQSVMEWSVVGLYEKLYTGSREPNSFTVAKSDNAFSKQYNLLGGSTKYFPQYFEYIYNLKEVQDKLLISSNKESKIFLLVLFLGFVLPLVIFTNYNPLNNDRIQSGECIKSCIKQFPNTWENKDGLSFDDFSAIRFIKKAFTD